MEIDNRPKPNHVRILAGPIAKVEAELNDLWEEWTPLVWNFVPVGSELQAVVVVGNSRELRQAMMLSGGGAMPMRR